VNGHSRSSFACKAHVLAAFRDGQIVGYVPPVTTRT
jgi:hypothetical protein